jgi:5'-nucleotidase (lipoprotein e(P4) family)
MNLGTRSVLVLVLASVLFLVPASFVAAEDSPAAPAYTQKDVNEQMVMALLWMQSSAEYKELCYQAFNLAGMIVDKSVAAAKAGDKPLAVIADLDESLLDNSAYDAGLIGRDAAYSGKTWTQWENAAQALAIPGAVEFVKYAASKKVEVYYVTNRDQAGLDGTLKNLAALGFPFADARHLMVSAGSSNKQPRFDQVAKDYTVIAYIGDNENDMPIGSYHKSLKDRNALVDQNKDKYGTQFIVIPNPSYGDWESAIADGYFKLTPAAMSAARKAALRSWVPPAQPRAGGNSPGPRRSPWACGPRCLARRRRGQRPVTARARR